MHRIFRALVLLLPALFLFAPQAFAAGEEPPVTDLLTDVGLLGLNVTNLGYIGHAWSKPYFPSCQYPLYSNTEHIYRGGLWVGARTPDGELRVSTGAQDANGLSEGDDIREFTSDTFVDPAGEELDIGYWSNLQNSDNYRTWARAPEHFELAYNDYHVNQAGSHVPLGIKVIQSALVWSQSHASDFVMMDYRIINISGSALEDVYVGLWVDTTVGSTELRDPYDSQAAVRWTYYDDLNGAWGARDYVDPQYTVSGDPDIWMAYEHDEDGDEGLADSWIGYRLLGTSDEPEPEEGVHPVSYNAWVFRGVPERDSWYREDDDPDSPLQPGKYQVMSNGDFTVEDRQDPDYTRASNWVGLLSTGPFKTFAPNDTLRVGFAIVAGADSLDLLENSLVAQAYYGSNGPKVNPPPSPLLEVSYDDEAVILQWEGGAREDESGELLEVDSPLRQPEYHLSDVDLKEDFQGYRVYRFRGDNWVDSPFHSARADEIRELGPEVVLSQIVGEFDIIDGIGYDTGLPEKNAQGKREFVDRDLLTGFPYRYAVTSFSTPRPDIQVGSLESGYGENDTLLYPGPFALEPEKEMNVVAFPNPYRAGSAFDGRNPSQIEQDRKIWFKGLPANCSIKIYTIAGELVQTLHHNDPQRGQTSWNLLSSYNRVIASGLYIYVVEDHASGEFFRGKLVIIK